jgi:nucleotide sugar dehydrogenase
MSFKSISVVGLGYVGLPLALEFAKAGIIVYGIEQNPKKVEMVNKGESYIDDVKSEDLLQVVKSGNLKAYIDFEPVKNSDAVIICVPTPLGTHKEPDISYIINVATEISKKLKKGQLIVLESTTYPGTTEEVLVPILEKSGLKAGEDFYVAFSPERVDPGNKQFTTKDIPKVVGGINQISTDKAGELYSLIVSKVFKVSSPKVAEMEKLLENIFRLVNISFINELAILCNKMGIDIWEVIQAASTKPYGFMPFYPGPGLGGHCIEGSEIVWVKDGSKSQIISLHDLFEKESIKYGIRKIGDVEVIKTKNLFVKSLDTNELKPIWKPITYLFRRNYTGKIVKIITDDNRYLRVTDKHPMLRINENKVEEVFAENLKVGDLLPMFLDEMNESSSINDIIVDLITELDDSWHKKVRVKLYNDSWKNYKDIIYSELDDDIKYDYIKNDYIPLWLFKKLEEKKRILIDHKNIILETGKGPSITKMPALIKIDENWARFIGYYLSEGCAYKEKNNYRIRITINKEEGELYNDIKNIINSIGLTSSCYISQINKTNTIRINSPLLGWLIVDRLNCGRNSYEMKIPDEILNANINIKKALLIGLFRGDGCVYIRNGRRRYSKNGKNYIHNDNSLVVEYFTISNILFDQLLYLLQEIGIKPSIKKSKNKLVISGWDQIIKVSDWFIDKKGEKIKKYFENSIRKINKKTWSKMPSVKVKNIEYEEVSNVPVYSMEVEDTHTFAVGKGIFVHNCIPIDPFYLSWKAKEYDFDVRFIELAGEINDNMPKYVVQLVMEALNKDKKAVNGSKIFVIGVSYKPNIADPRESPALKIILEIERLGGKVEYYDPYISEVKINVNGKDKVYKSSELTEEKVKNADCVLIVTDHDNVDYNLIYENAKRIVDTRNALRKRGINIDERVTLL